MISAGDLIPTTHNRKDNENINPRDYEEAQKIQNLLSARQKVLECTYDARMRRISNVHWGAEIMSI